MSNTVRDAVLELLRTHGMTTVFGNPGSAELGFLGGGWPADLRYVLALQEASAMAMADGYAQATGNAAFVNLHSAGGLGHSLGDLFTAFRNRAPLVVTAGQQVRSLLPHHPHLFAEDTTLLRRLACAEEPADALAWIMAQPSPALLEVPVSDPVERVH